jgi:hypothetical protein
LTASLTYAFSPKEIENRVRMLCFDLNLSGNCVYTASVKDLIKDGYHATHAEQLICKEDYTGLLQDQTTT